MKRFRSSPRVMSQPLAPFFNDLTAVLISSNRSLQSVKLSLLITSNGTAIPACFVGLAFSSPRAGEEEADEVAAFFSAASVSPLRGEVASMSPPCPSRALERWFRRAVKTVCDSRGGVGSAEGSSATPAVKGKRGAPTRSASNCGMTTTSPSA